MNGEILSSASSSSGSRKRAGSTDSDDSFVSKKSRSVSLAAEEGHLEPYVRRRRSSNEKAKSRLLKLDPEEQDRLRQCINSRERKRMHNLNSALDKLRKSLPRSTAPNSRRLSKIHTIETAADWITKLIHENEALRKILMDTGVSVPPLSAPVSLPSPPSTSTSESKSKPSTPRAAPPPPPPLDPAPHLNAATFFHPFLANYILHPGVAAAAAAAAAVGSFSPQRGPPPGPLLGPMPPTQLSNFCIKSCQNKCVGFCINCLLSKKNTVS